ADDRVPVAEAELDEVDLLLDDRRRVDRAAADGAHGEPAAAGLVAGEAGAVDEQDCGARGREPEGGGRARRPPTDHERVVTLHRLRLQCAALPGGVPERPKGTGCKPVGSAYGGSNPPAPTPGKDSNFFPASCGLPAASALSTTATHQGRPAQQPGAQQPGV